MNLPSIFHYLAPIIGFITVLIGIGAVIKPEAMSKNFGISVSGSALPYVVSTGIRDVFMGLVILILCYYQYWSVIGATMICIAVVAVSDFLVVRRHGDKRTSLVHLFGAIVTIGYGAWLSFYHFFTAS